MAAAEEEPSNQIHRFPQSKYIDAVRFLPPLAAFDRFVVAALHDHETNSSSLNLYSLNPNPDLHHKSSFPIPSRTSSLSLSQSPQKPVIAAATLAGSLHFLFLDPRDVSLDSEHSITDNSFHAGPISGIDVQSGGGECVSVGGDGLVNLVRVAESRVNSVRVGDSKGLSEYTAVRWGSEVEFATGGLGFGLQWWDQRKPGGFVSQFKGNNWSRGSRPGIVHSIDIHTSRKHMCLVGGSSGTVFAWDLRWQQQPVLLAGVGLDETTPSLSMSEVWKVQYDTYRQSLNTGSMRILPAMMCSEDGILAVLEQGEEPIEELAEPCAINSFDIDPQNPSNVIYSMEWEAIALLTRP